VKHPPKSPLPVGGRAWQLCLVAGALAGATYFLTLSDGARGIVFTGAHLAAGAVIALSGRGGGRGPWLVVGLGFVVKAMGDGVWFLSNLVWHKEGASIVLAANAFYLVGYSLLGAGLLWMAYRRNRKSLLADLTDGVIICASAVVLSAVSLMSPFFAAPGLDGPDLLLSIALPVMDILLLFGLTTLVSGATRPAMSLRLLVIGLGSHLAADTLYYAASVDAGYVVGGAMDALWFVAWGFASAAALHPSSVSGAPEAARPVRKLSRRRMVWFAIASLTGPAYSVLAVLRGGDPHYGIVLAGSVTIALAVLFRLAGSVKEIEAKMDELDAQSAELQNALAEGRRVYEQLSEAELKYRSLVEHLPALVYVWNLDSTPAYVSPYIESLTGYPADAFFEDPGLSMQLIHPSDRQAVQEEWERATGARKPFYMEYRMGTQDRGTIWVRNEGRVLTNDDDESLFVQGVVLDITREREAGERLRATEARYRTLVEHIPAVTFIDRIDAERTNLYISPQIEQLVGYSPPEWRARQLWFKAVHPDDVDRVRAQYRRDNEDPTSFAVEYRLIARDGRVVWVRQEAFAVAGDDSRPAFWQGVLIDVSEMRDAEAKRRLLEERLLHSQKMEAVGQLAGGIAHDFNNLLAVIQNYASFLMEELADDDPRHADAVDIFRSSQRAAQLVKQLLTFSRREVVDPEIVDLNDILKDIESLLRRTIPESIELDFSMAGQELPVLVDRGQIEQVLMNLTVNARDAMPNGGRLAFATHAPAGEEGIVHLAVSDTGRGMPREVAERIFEPFFTTKPRDAGTGLGLATVYGIVEQSGGTIEVKSQEGAGTTFWIGLPISDGVSAEAGNALPVSTPPRPMGETVLVAEDERGVREVVQRILSRKGYKVLVASSGPEALEVAARFEDRIDILLTDVVMPQMSGWELAERLRIERTGLKIVYMSGYAEDALAPNTASNPAITFIEKPFSAEALILKLRQVLEAA
jgi:two-component system, cell cycle sensor histidine kinase and response regulator CckA